jgi:hypothetical protein
MTSSWQSRSCRASGGAYDLAWKNFSPREPIGGPPNAALEDRRELMISSPFVRTRAHPRPLGLALIVGLGLGACAPAPTAATTPAPAAATTPAAAPPAAARNPLYQQFLGPWTGHLEYRDFQSDEQVFLPTWLTITEGGDALQLDFIYDDGPTKVIRERMRLKLDGAAEISSDRDQTRERYQVSGLDEFAKLGRGVLTLTGTGQENDRPVDVLIKLTLRRNMFTLRKETRAAGEPFRFRHGYAFTRAAPPSLP